MKPLLLTTITAIVSTLFIFGCGAHRHRDLNLVMHHCLQDNLSDDSALGAIKCLKAASPKRNPVEAFLLADLLDATGQPAGALPYYFSAIERSHQKKSFAAEAVAAGMGVVAIRSRIENFDARFAEFMSRLSKQKGSLPPEAWFQLRQLELGLAKKKGESKKVKQAQKQIGCLVDWQVAGPFGPHLWVEFNRDFLATSHWPQILDLGLGMGKTTPREVTSQSCFVTVTNPAIISNGVTWAKSSIELDTAQTIFFRIQTSASVVVRIADKEIFRRDLRNGWASKVSWFAADLQAGKNTITVELASSIPQVGFSLVPVTQEMPPTLSRGDPMARLRIAIWWEDMELAKSILRTMGEPKGILLAAKSEIIASDPSLPGEISYNQAHSLSSAALEDEPLLYRSRIDVADRELAEDRGDVALKIINKGLELTPDEPSLISRLLNILASLGWIKEFDEAMRDFEQLMPTSCETLSWKMALAKRLQKFDESAKIAKQINLCDSGSSALAEELMRAQKWDEAIEEYQRISDQNPLSFSAIFEVAKAALASGDLDGAKKATNKALKKAPSVVDYRLGLADLLASSGDVNGAKKVIEEGIAWSLGSRGLLEQRLAALEQRPLLPGLRIDGLEVIKKYKAEKNSYDTAAVFVLDRTVHIIADRGAMSSVVHTITHIGSEDAVEQFAEFSVPEEAIVLNVRTIKADGRILEPEKIANKTTLSLLDVEKGDFVETEYIEYKEPTIIFPGGFDTKRFFFRDFQTAFHRSEFLVILPHEVKYQIDPRGDCPNMVEKKHGDFRVLTWSVRGTLPFADEPHCPNPVEFLPSIRVVGMASWDMLLARIRDLMADKDRPSHYLKAALDEALKNTDETDHKARREAIYYWIIKNIEPDFALFEQSSHSIVRRTGNQARLFVSLLKLARYEPRLALVKATGADEYKDAVADFGMYDYLMVWHPDDGWINFGVEGAPYGYLPAKLRQRPAVFIDNGKKVTTSAGNIPFDKQKIDISCELLSGGAAKCTVKETLTGLLAAGWRAQLESTAQTDWNAQFQESYVAFTFAGASLKKMEAVNIIELSKPLILLYDLEFVRMAKPEGDNLLVTIPPAMTISRDIGGLPTRVTPLVFSEKLERTVNAVVTLPPNTKIALKPNDNLESKWGTTKRWAGTKDSKVEIGYDIKISADRISPEQYPGFLQFIRRADLFSQMLFELTPVKHSEI